MNNSIDKDSANLDPISGEPGSHPVGTGVGAAAGGAAGAAIGAIGGPIGIAAGTVIGAVAGGLAGKAGGEAANPTVEDAYWRAQYTKEPYYNAGRSYDDYAPAYRTGYEARNQYEGRRFDDIQAELERKYDATRGSSSLAWSDAKQATRAAWDRLERAIPGDADRDGK